MVEPKKCLTNPASGLIDDLRIHRATLGTPTQSCSHHRAALASDFIKCPIQPFLFFPVRLRKWPMLTFAGMQKSGLFQVPPQSFLLGDAKIICLALNFLAEPARRV